MRWTSWKKRPHCRYLEGADQQFKEGGSTTAISNLKEEATALNEF